MKVRLLLLVIGLNVLFCCALYAEEIGRFQLITRKTEGSSEQLYKIDTVIGKVWIYEENELLKKEDFSDEEEFKKIEKWAKGSEKILFRVPYWKELSESPEKNTFVARDSLQ